ncbi:MAG: hypothetical protein K1X39_03670 [Thermoflexales bacterium]|nr:hypothetical protein [Thermoflexales bacterium]
MAGLEITPEDWARMRAEPARPRLIDVREGWETALARLPEAEWLPMGEIYNWSGTLDKAGRYVLICHLGERSAMACQFLRSLGFRDVQNFAGGIDAWSRRVDGSVPRY